MSAIEVDNDAVVLRLSVSRRAEGTRLSPPQQLWEVFTVEGAEIVDICFYLAEHQENLITWLRDLGARSSKATTVRRL